MKENQDGDTRVKTVNDIFAYAIVELLQLDQPYAKRDRPIDYCDHLWEQAVIDIATEAVGDDSVGIYLAHLRVWSARCRSWIDVDKVMCEECGLPLKEESDHRNKEESDKFWQSAFGRMMGVSPEKFNAIVADQAAQGKTTFTHQEMERAVQNSDVKADETWNAHTGRQISQAWNDAIGGPVRGKG